MLVAFFTLCFVATVSAHTDASNNSNSNQPITSLPAFSTCPCGSPLSSWTLPLVGGPAAVISSREDPSQCWQLASSAGPVTCAGICVTLGNCSYTGTPLWSFTPAADVSPSAPPAQSAFGGGGSTGGALLLRIASAGPYSGFCLDQDTDPQNPYIQAYRCESGDTHQTWAVSLDGRSVMELWDGRSWCVSADYACHTSPYGPAVAAYRALVQARSVDVPAWSAAALAVREWTAARDPHSPIYHFRSVEGWLNDPNGLVYEARTGLYHRSYQYRFVESSSANSLIAWGHSISRDLVSWVDWPVLFWPDTPWDDGGVFSGNCVIDGGGTPVCVYTGVPAGAREPATAAPRGPGAKTYGVCARSADSSWQNWSKSDCMDASRAPNSVSPVNWDTSAWSDAGVWYALIGGCTESPELGAAFLWSSLDLANWTLVGNIWPTGGPSNFFELPYLLPFDASGQPAPHETATQHAFLFGSSFSNTYFVGYYNRSSHVFTAQPGQPAPFIADPGAFYSFNPSLTDARGTGASARRSIMFGWVTGAASPTVAVPYWQGAHSLPRVLTLAPAGTGGAAAARLLQQPLPELALLRGNHFPAVSVSLPTTEGAPPAPLLNASGDALEISVVVDLRQPAGVTAVGVAVRATPDGRIGVRVAVDVATLAVTTSGSDTGVLTGDCSLDGSVRAARAATLRIFVDRSVVEIYCGGSAILVRTFPMDAASAVHVAPFAVGAPGVVASAVVEGWTMLSMWQ